MSKSRVSSPPNSLCLGLLITLLLGPTAAAEYPSHIKLRAGVLHSPPFAFIEQVEDSEDLSFRGFQPDLLKRLQIFAAADNVTLEFELSRSPPQYGAALDLVANDCAVGSYGMDCDQFDLIVGDYYVNAERSMRIDFTPAWLRSTISTIKKTKEAKEQEQDSTPTTMDYTTLDQANKGNAKVCVLAGAYMQTVIRGRFPNADYVECANNAECLSFLQQDRCVLYADDELMLRYQQTLNPTLEVTREQFNSQFMVWPMRYDLPPMVSQLLKKWVYAAVANATMDELYFQYFEAELCPVGTAGENCDQPCDPNHGTSNAQGVCVCESIRWTGDDCSIEIEEDFNEIPTAWKAVAFAMLGINVLVIAACGTWLYLHRNSAPVRVSQPFFLVLVLLGCLISSSTIIVLSQEDDNGDEDNVPACMAIPWFYSVGFCVTFGTLFAKILRIYRIFTQSAQQPVMRRSNSNRTLSSTGEEKEASQPFQTHISRDPVTFTETLMVIGAVLAIDICILIAWTVLDPLTWERTIIQADQFGVPLESQGYCNCDHWYIFGTLIAVFHLTLLGVASYLCVQARKIPSKYSESKYVSIAMISNLQIFVVGVPILIIVSNDPQASFFVRSAIIWMNDLAVVVILFSNLMWTVHVSSKEDNTTMDKIKMKQALNHYSFGASMQGSKLGSFPIVNSGGGMNIVGPNTADVPGNMPPETTIVNTATLISPQQRTLMPRRSLVSSLSAGSGFSDYTYEKDKTPEFCTEIGSSSLPRDKTVSWGSVSYSEAEEGQASAPVELGNPHYPDGCSGGSPEASGELRFVACEVQPAMRTPRRRPSIESESDELDIEECHPDCFDRKAPLHQIVTTQSGNKNLRCSEPPVQGDCENPPRIPSRLSSQEFDLPDAPSTSTEKTQHLSVHGPPGLPCRLASVVEEDSHELDVPKPSRFSRRGELLDPSSGPPQLPSRLPPQRSVPSATAS